MKNLFSLDVITNNLTFSHFFSGSQTDVRVKSAKTRTKPDAAQVNKKTAEKQVAADSVVPRSRMARRMPPLISQK